VEQEALPLLAEKHDESIARGYDMLLCKKIKIEVSQQDAEALEFMQAKCRGLYNWWVMKLRNGERWNVNAAKKSLRESKQYDPELRSVYGKLLAEVYYRLDGAMKGFFHRVKAGENPGFPRFKPRHRFFTLCYPAMYLEIRSNIIILPTGGGGNWGPKRYENINARLTEAPLTTFVKSPCPGTRVEAITARSSTTMWSSKKRMTRTRRIRDVINANNVPCATMASWPLIWVSRL
jgi:hypothetical protein